MIIGLNSTSLINHSKTFQKRQEEREVLFEGVIRGRNLKGLREFGIINQICSDMRPNTTEMDAAQSNMIIFLSYTINIHKQNLWVVSIDYPSTNR